MRILIVCIAVLLLAGCQDEVEPTAIPPTPTAITPEEGFGVSGWEVKSTFEEYGYIFEPKMNGTVFGIHPEYTIGITLYRPMENLSAVDITYPLVSIEHSGIVTDHTWLLCSLLGFDVSNLVPLMQDLSEGKRTSSRSFGNIKVTATEGRLAGMNINQVLFEAK